MPALQTCQTQDCSSAAQRLRSDALNDKAWGAELAADCSLSELAGEIGMELVALGPGTRFGSETFWADRAMLDALIRLGAPIPSPLLASIANAFPKEAIILVLRDAPSHLELLTDIRNRRGGLESIAASNALSRLRAPGFGSIDSDGVSAPASVFGFRQRATSRQRVRREQGFGLADAARAGGFPRDRHV